MGQDSWNLQYGRQKPAKYRRGTSVDMHPDEGYGGPHMIPGYAGPYKNWKGKVIGEKTLKANGNPRNFGPNTDKKSTRFGQESGVMKPTTPKRRK